MVISIIIFIAKRGLQHGIGPAWKGDTRPPSLQRLYRLSSQPSGAPYLFAGAIRCRTACLRMGSACSRAGRHYINKLVLSVVTEEVDSVVGILAGRQLSNFGRPPWIPDDFGPDNIPKFILDLFLLAFPVLLHLNITNNIFILQSTPHLSSHL